jgi:hypothetical protein
MDGDRATAIKLDTINQCVSQNTFLFRRRPDAAIALILVRISPIVTAPFLVPNACQAKLTGSFVQNAKNPISCSARGAGHGRIQCLRGEHLHGLLCERALSGGLRQLQPARVSSPLSCGLALLEAVLRFPPHRGTASYEWNDERSKSKLDRDDLPTVGIIGSAEIVESHRKGPLGQSRPNDIGSSKIRTR